MGCGLPMACWQAKRADVLHAAECCTRRSAAMPSQWSWPPNMPLYDEPISQHKSYGRDVWHTAELHYSFPISTGRKLAFCWRSCTQGRHAVGNCGAGWSEGGTPLSRDGALLYSRAPGVVVIGVSFQVEGGTPLSILPCGFGGNCYQ